MFRKVKRVELNFIMTVSKDNLRILPKILTFYKKNSDIISRVFFTLYRDIFFKKPAMEDTKNYISLERLANLIRKIYKVEPCAYLGKTLDPQKPSWLYFAPILLGKKVIGHADKRTVEKVYSQNQNGPWNSSLTQEKKIKLLKSLPTLSFPCAIKTIIGYIGAIIKNPANIIKSPKCQIIHLINTPKLTDKGWDLCDGCPDAILYKGQLVPSCLLERIKLGEGITL